LTNLRCLAPRDPSLPWWYSLKSFNYFALRQDHQAIEWARRAIAIKPDLSLPRGYLAAALALTGHEDQAREEQQRRMELSPFKSIKAFKAIVAPPTADPRVRAAEDRLIEGLRNAGLPDE
jgi:adenylate cyclase